jgi:hypothetical protein
MRVRRRVMVIDDTRTSPRRRKNAKMQTIRSKVIQVQVKLPTALAKYSPKLGLGVPFTFEIPDASTVSDLINYLAVPETEVSIIFVNGFHRPGEFQLKNDDVVSLYPVVGSWIF